MAADAARLAGVQRDVVVLTLVDPVLDELHWVLVDDGRAAVAQGHVLTYSGREELLGLGVTHIIGLPLAVLHVLLSNHGQCWVPYLQDSTEHQGRQPHSQQSARDTFVYLVSFPSMVG